MKVFTRIEDVRNAMYQIVELLAAKQYDTFLDMVYPASHREETINKIILGISSHGVYDSCESPHYSVVFLEDKYRETFEKFIEIDTENLYGMDATIYCGLASCFLPLDQHYEGDVSDLKLVLAIRKHIEGFCLEFNDICST